MPNPLPDKGFRSFLCGKSTRMMGSVPHPVFDPLIHEPTRLQLCGLLVAAAEREFANLRDELGIADSSLSKHLTALRTAGYVTVERRFGAGHGRAYAVLTDTGRHAFCGHIAELQRLARVASPRVLRARG
jgi:DNA-binding transcriptional ArsR family regulator